MNTNYGNSNTSEDEMYLNPAEVHTTFLTLERINMQLPEDQIKIPMPEFFVKAAGDLLGSLKPYYEENKKIVTPDLLLKLLGPITAPALVIAVIHACEIPKGESQSWCRSDSIGAKWRLLANKMMLADFYYEPDPEQSF